MNVNTLNMSCCYYCEYKLVYLWAKYRCNEVLKYNIFYVLCKSIEASLGTFFTGFCWAYLDINQKLWEWEFHYENFRDY